MLVAKEISWANSMQQLVLNNGWKKCKKLKENDVDVLDVLDIRCIYLARNLRYINIWGIAVEKVS